MSSKKRVTKSGEKVQHKHWFSFSYKNDSTRVSFSIDKDTIEFTEEKIVDDIVREALALKIPTGTAEIIAKKVAEAVVSKFHSAKAKNSEEVDASIADEMQKYHENLAYVYKNRGKII